MIRLEPPYRAATINDAPALAELCNAAGEGLPLYLWRGMAKAGEDPWAVGRQRAARESGSFSYRNAIVREADDRVIGCMIGYPLPAEPEPIDYATMPEMFVPLQELENLAPKTWYLNVLAFGPEWRGRGLGSKFLALADRIAADLGSDGVSIIVSDNNAGARRLYERHGFRQLATRPAVKDGWENAILNWVLLIKSAQT